MTAARLAEIQRMYEMSVYDGAWSDEHWSALWDCRRAVPELIAEVRRLHAAVASRAQEDADASRFNLDQMEEYASKDG